MSIDIDPRQLLEAACKAAGSQTEWARANGVSKQYVWDVLRRGKPPGAAILNALGIERVYRLKDA